MRAMRTHVHRNRCDTVPSSNEICTETWNKDTEKGGLGHVPREPAFKKPIPVTLAFPAQSPRKETGKMHNSVHSSRSLSC